MTLVQSLVTLHGGRIEVNSEGLGYGSEFIVRLPLAEALPQPDRSVQADRPVNLSALRILVVDDIPDVAVSLALLLRQLGAEVRTEHSGPAALEVLESFRPSIVLLDIGMPGMDGYEVARRIRQQPENRDIVLIALTGWGQDEDRQHSQEAGFDHHLVKPVNLAALKELLRSSINNDADS